MVEVGVEGNDLLLGVVGARKDSWDHAGVLCAVDGGEGLNADVGVEAIVDLGGVFEIVAVADGAIADVAGDEDSLGRVNCNEAGIGVVHGAVGEVGSGEDLWHRCWRRDGPGHVEVDGIVADFSALAEIGKLNSLHLEFGKAVADEGVASVIAGGEREVRVVVGVGGIAVLKDRVHALGLNHDAAGEQSNGGAIFEMTRGLGRGTVRVVAGAGRGGKAAEVVSLAPMRELKSWGVDGDLRSVGVAGDAGDGELFGMAGEVVGAGDDDLVSGLPGWDGAVDVEGRGADVGHGDGLVEAYPAGSRVGGRGIDGGPVGGDLADAFLAAQVEDASIRDGEDFFAEECSVGVALVEDFILIKAVGADGGGGIDGRSLGARAGGHRHLPHGDVLGDEGI